MKKNGTFGDEHCLHVIANIIGRDIILIPVHAESATFLGKRSKNIVIVMIIKRGLVVS